MIKIFVLEDCPERTEWFKKTFSECDLHITHDVKEACSKLENNEFDFIFLDRDLSNPHENGEDVAWYMMQNKLAEKTPVIIHSVNKRGQRVISRYLGKYKDNVEVMDFNRLKHHSADEILKTSQTDTKTVKENQSVVDFLVNNLSIVTDKSINNDALQSRKARAAAGVFCIWRNKNNRISSNVYRKPLQISEKDIEMMEKENFIKCIGNNIKITQKGSEIIKTMILGDDRSSFEKKGNDPITLRQAESNIKKKKKHKEGQKLADTNWWDRFTK